jgi:hypothetical protein
MNSADFGMMIDFNELRQKTTPSSPRKRELDSKMTCSSGESAKKLAPMTSRTLEK